MTHAISDIIPKLSDSTRALLHVPRELRGQGSLSLQVYNRK